MTAKVTPEVIDYLYESSNGIGFSMCVSSSSVRMAAYIVSKRHGIDCTHADVIATMRHMLRDGQLRESGAWGNDTLYSIRPEMRGSHIEQP